MHASAEDMGDADSGGDAGARACGATWQRLRRWRWLRRRQYSHALHQVQRQGKQGKDGVGEQLAGKGEL